ncbi:MAG: LPXTG cell wall anchor domain-containing protein, partial [Eubacteriales bacterium]|nr:LPXTG cell wall anchor domain-containing protein [Eubacteriales bacterium]MDD4140992.1 LPXTG cell wall anchor domain-containing protein [Eubacteriales bacterium]
TFTYTYTSVDGDIGSVRINTAHVIGTATATLDDEVPITVEDSDTAGIAVDEIPKTGESGSLPYIGLGMLLAAGVLILLRRRSTRNSQV